MKKHSSAAQVSKPPNKMSQNSKREATRTNRKSAQQQQHHNEETRNQKLNIQNKNTTDGHKLHKQKTNMLNEAVQNETTVTSKISDKNAKRKEHQQQQHAHAQQPNSNHNTNQHNNNNNKALRALERQERKQLVLWRRPVLTLKYAMLQMFALIRSSAHTLLQQRLFLLITLFVSIALTVLYHAAGPHQLLFELIRQNTWFVVYWVGLGVLSSVGLGTGLHTFLLYLGPHIASVTLAAYECNSLNFPQPPYPDDIICPDEPYIKKMPNIWSIMSKVRWEAFLWGAGTALGELPPYFMAKAARLSGEDSDDDEDLNEFKALQAKKNQKNLSLIDRGKLFVERVVERIGFLGILVCASVPNPLFDLAGITCGHFLVPFWTFFGATLIGKAIIKMHLQKIFVIIAFNETLIERAVDLLGKVPVIGRKLQTPFKTFLQHQKQHLHRRKDAKVAESGNLLSRIFEMFVIGMILYFVISIVNSLAQSYHQQLYKRQDKKKSNKKQQLRKEL